MKTVIPVQSATDTAAPSTQEMRLVSNPDTNYLIWTIVNIPGTGPVRTCFSLDLPILAPSDFGTVDFPYPPTGKIYFFANSANSNAPSTINHAGTITAVGVNVDPSFNSVSIEPTDPTASAELIMGDAEEAGISYDPSSKVLLVGGAFGTINQVALEGSEIKLGTKGGDKIGFFNTTPVTQRTITAAAPTDTATLITQVTALKTLLDDLGLLNLV